MVGSLVSHATSFMSHEHRVQRYVDTERCADRSDRVEKYTYRCCKYSDRRNHVAYNLQRIWRVFLSAWLIIIRIKAARTTLELNAIPPRDNDGSINTAYIQISL